MYINTTNAHQGLFGDISSGAFVKNVVVKNSTIITTSSNAGAIVGTLDGGSSRIVNCHSNARVYAESSVGGLVGVAYHGSIIDSSFDGYVEGNNTIGGISGYLRGSDIDNCFSNANIKCITNDAGGIVGASEIEESSVVKCKFTGSIQGARAVAGIIGSIRSGVVNIGDVIVCGQICYIYTDTSEPGAYFGTMIGWDIGVNAILNNCCFVGDSNIAINPICVHNNSATSCFSIINRQGYYSSGDFADWAVIPSMNDGLPMQKSLYHIAQFGEGIDAAWFSRQGYTKV